MIQNSYKLALALVILSSTILFAQSSNTAADYFSKHGLSGMQSMYATGDSCSALYPEIHDGKRHSNAYTELSDSVRWVTKFRPNVYPWIYNNVCIGLTSTVRGSSLTYRVAVYDSNSSGPFLLLYESDPITVTDVPVYPAYGWFSNALNLPALYRGVRYIGIVYSNQPNSNVYICADETSPSVWPGYVSTFAQYPSGFVPIQQDTSFANYRCLAIRTNGTPIFSDNYALTTPAPQAATNYVEVPHRDEMNSFNQITIECWTKILNHTSDNVIVEVGNSPDYYLCIAMYPNEDYAPFFVARDTVAFAWGWTFPVNEWTHLAFTYDGTTAKFYGNGELKSSQVIPFNIISDYGTMRFGSSHGPYWGFAGDIDELRIWNVARTQGEIDTNKCIKSPRNFIGGSQGLLANWHFDMNYEDSVSGWNGTPHGYASFDTVSNPSAGVDCITIPIGIHNESSEVPRDYSLGQNYPNPFNPLTVISFSLPKDEYVELKIYDALGNEVTALVKEPVRKGKYSVTFDASQFASGVYFYKLTAGSFAESKKMVLIK